MEDETKITENSVEKIIEIPKYTLKTWIKSLVLGIFYGLAIILPGISGSTIAIIFKIYDKILYCISNIFKKFKTCFLFLLPILVGAIFGFTVGFFALQSIIEQFTFIVVCVFGGLMLGASPEFLYEIKDEIKKPKWYQIVLIIVGFIFPILIAAIFVNVEEIDNSEMLANFPFYSFIIAFLLGICVSITQIIPGLSATVLLMSLGFFKPIMNAIHISVLSEEPRWILFLFLFVLGFIVGFFLLSKVLTKLFEEHKKTMYFLISGLSLGSIVSIFYNSDVAGVYSARAKGEGNMTLDLAVGIPLFVIFTVVAFLLVIYQIKKTKVKVQED